MNNKVEAIEDVLDEAKKRQAEIEENTRELTMSVDEADFLWRLVDERGRQGGHLPPGLHAALLVLRYRSSTPHRRCVVTSGAGFWLGDKLPSS